MSFLWFSCIITPSKHQHNQIMRLFIDCEFNGWQGELISMAIVPEMGEHYKDAAYRDNPIRQLLNIAINKGKEK